MNVRLILSVLLPFVACTMQWLLWKTISPYVWFLFFPAAFFSAWLGGLTGGLISTVISSLLVWYVFIPPRFSFALENPASAFSIAIFVVMGGLFAYIFDRLQQAQRRSDQARAQAEAASEKITELYKRTLELDVLKNNFFANVSHELRTPLTLIMSPLALRLSRDAMDDAQRSEVEMMLRNARQLYARVTDLLDAAKLQGGKMTVEYGKLDLAALLRDCTAQFDTIAKEKGHYYRIDVPQTFQIEADGAMIQRIMLNLLSNAFKFTPEAGIIEVHLRAEASEAVIAVQDNGPGVPAEMREAVFERFHQLDGGSRRHYSGTGLGLSIVRDLATLHGGDATMSEAPGGGAMVVVRLPLGAPSGVQVADAPVRLDPLLALTSSDDTVRRTEATEPRPGAIVAANAPMILVVEDNVDMNAFIAGTLRPYYRVACAFDGLTGLAQADALKPDLILCDIMMPGMSGDQLVIELRKNAEIVDVPIVIVTAKADESLHIRMLQEGVQGYLNKPFTVDELLALVGNLTKARGRIASRIRESEIRFEATFEQAAVGIALVAPDGHWLRVNRQLCQIVGYSQQELLARDFQSITYADDLAVDLANVQMMLVGEIQTYSIEKRYIHKHGQVFWIKLTVALVRKEDSTPDYFISVVEDIQARKAAEAAVLVSAQDLRVAQQVAGLGSWQWDVKNDVHTWSEEIFHLYGRDPKLPPAVYPEVQEYFTSESWAGLAAAVDRCVASGEPYQHDAEVVRPDGTHRWVTARGDVRRDASGTVVRMFGTVQDITERKQAELAASKANKLLQEAISSLADGFTIFDENDRLLVCNQAYLNIYGTSRDLIVPGISFEEMVRKGAQRGQYREAVGRVDEWVRERVRKHQAADGSQLEQLLDDGRWLLILEYRTPSGFIVGNRIDITARKAAEAELEMHRHHLEQLVEERTAELSAATLAAEAANVAKSAFLANMSHEIRTPINGVLGMLGILRREGITPQQSRRFDVIDASAQHLLSVINDILDISKIEAGKFTLEKAPVVIISVMTNVISIISEPARAKGLELEIETVALPANLVGDPTRLQQALLNYANNAVKFTERGRVMLRAFKREETNDSVIVQFEVQDSGIGIEPEAMTRLFGAFEQADSSLNRKYGGTGLGLAITKRLAELMGGAVGAQSTPGVGSTFWFTVRLKKSGASATDPTQATATAADTEAAIRRRCHGQRILVVDDEPINLEVTVMQLQAIELVVDAAVDGAQAIALAGKYNYAAILMDMQMPKVNGLEATRQIRQKGGYRNVPIIAVTANAFAEDRTQCLEAGMNDVLIKPFKPQELYATLLRWLTSTG